MKKLFLKVGIFTLLILILPSISLIINSIDEKNDNNSSNNNTNKDNYIIELPNTYKLLIEESGEILQLTPREYLKGCMLANIPADYEPEMLKAMATVINTYGLMLYKNRDTFEDASLNGADFSDNADKYLKYYSDDKGQEIYGDDFENIFQNIDEAVEFGIKYALVYNGELIMPAFHSISTGKTDNSKDIFGEELPYLSSAESQNDILSPNYYGSKKMESSEVMGALMRIDIDIMLDYDINTWFKNIKLSPSGSVLSADCGDKTFTGRELQNKLGLRSPAFEVVIEDGMFLFKTKGFGHNVGLSLYGGNKMALDGKTASEILTHYYKDIQALILN